jgi:hypothetical protein
MDNTTLATASNEISKRALFRLGAMIGGAALMEEAASQFDAKKIELLEQIRDEKLYLEAGYKSWDECCKAILGPKRTLDRKIREFKEQGPDLFNLRQMVRIGTATYEHLQIEDGHIVHDGRKIAIVKQNEAEIKGIIKHYQDLERKAREDSYEKERALKKARDERDNAKKAATKLQQELRDKDRAAQLAWQHADPDQADMIQLEQDFDFLLTKLAAFVNRNLSPDNQNRLVALSELLWARTHQATDRIRGEYGVGLLAPRPGESTEVDELTPHKRSLVEEYEEAHPLKK